jgi:hypothetical protein
METKSNDREESAFISLSGRQYASGYESAGMEKAVSNYGNIGRTFDNVLPGISIKSQYSKADYDFYRQNENRPENPREIMDVCNRAYKQEGLVRNIIDLMAEFAKKGIQIIHPNKRIEKFGQEWGAYVGMDRVSERFLNLLYRLAHVPVSITYGKVPVYTEKKWLSAYSKNEMVVERSDITKRRIPLKYEFLNPLSIEMVAPELAAFTGKPMYALLITQSLRSAINKASRMKNDAALKELLLRIPEDIRNALNTNTHTIPLNDDDFRMFYYKKDDWETYATPIIYSIISDIVTLEKMKLADRSALDGAISNIRLWTIGQLTDNPQTTLIPNKAMINKLRGILANNVGGGTMDLVWGPDLKFSESNTQVHHFLGIDKYEPIYRGIYEGMGIPSSVAGGSDGGFNNSFIQMQTFIERLEYGRNILLEFWNCELKKVQEAMGYSKPFKVSFDQISLGDDSAVKTILMGLVDRDIISVDTLLSKFDMFSDIERERIKREFKMRQKDNLPDKASPFHNPQDAENTKRAILNQGGVAPSELGIELQDRKPGEESLIEKQSKFNIQEEKFKPKSATNGRPPTKKDSGPRKKRSVKVSKTAGFMPLFLWANTAQKQISDIVTPLMVKSMGCKSDVRSLSVAQTEQIEGMKIILLSNITPYQDITRTLISSIAVNSPTINTDICTATKTLVYKFTQVRGRAPNIDEMRQIQSSAYALYHEECDEVEGEESDI